MSEEPTGAGSVTVTLDIEDHRGDAPGPKRHAEMTRRLMESLTAHGVRATVFIVGDLCATNSDLIRDIAGQGHEVGLHSFDHRPLHDHDPMAFGAKTRDARRRLQDLTGQSVTGYRAPSFSLTRQTPWVPDALRDLGFGYSSSVLPAGNPIFGFPGAPRQPFRWPCGLLEIPAPVARVGPVVVPFLGGLYFRYLPEGTIRRSAARDRTQALWSYLHPYDIDAAEPFCRPHGAALWASLLLWFRRRGALRRFDRLLAGKIAGIPAPPFEDRIARGDFDAAAAVPSNDLP